MANPSFDSRACCIDCLSLAILTAGLAGSTEDTLSQLRVIDQVLCAWNKLLIFTLHAFHLIQVLRLQQLKVNARLIAKRASKRTGLTALSWQIKRNNVFQLEIFCLVEILKDRFNLVYKGKQELALASHTHLLHGNQLVQHFHL